MNGDGAETAEDGPARGLDFLPDLCGRRETFGLVLLAALTAIVVTLLRAPFGGAFWVELGANGLYLLWIALLSAGAICAGRRRLARWHRRAALAVLYVVLLLCALAVALGARLLLPTGVGPGPAGLARTLAVAAIVDALALRHLVAIESGRRAARRADRARFQALEARLRPHFLFNTLNTLAALARHEPARAEQAILDLAELFRASLDRAGGTSTLGEEIALARRYLALEELRLGGRLRVEWRCADLPEDALVPALLLQPLLENAVYHGLESAPEGGAIEIGGGREPGGLSLVVANSLGPREGERRGRGVAQAALAERLALFFPDAPPLTAGREDGRYVVRLRFPYRRTSGES